MEQNYTPEQYKSDLQLAKAQQTNMNANAYANTMIGNQGKQNLVEWELDFKPELEDIERLLRCDILVRDKEGEHWEVNPHKDRIFFNELGVSDLIRNIIIIVNKNKALSFYDHEEINQRVRQIKHEIRVIIYNNYEIYGMDNDYKMNNYSFIVLSVGSIIEDVYRRAMNGETHKGLSEQRLVTQNDSVNQNQYQMPQINNTPKHWYNPMSWRK